MKKKYLALVVIIIVILNLTACNNANSTTKTQPPTNTATSDQTEASSPKNDATPSETTNMPTASESPATIEDFTTKLDLTPYYTEDGFDLDAVAEYYGFTKGPEKPDDGHITYLRQIDGITCSAQYHSTGPYPIGASCAENYSERGAALWRIEPEDLVNIQSDDTAIRIKNYNFSIPKGLEIVLSYILENSAHVDPAPFPSNMKILTIYPNQQ